MDLWRKGGFRYLWREWRERAREQDMKERGHAIPRLPAVPETPMELLTSAFLTLASSLYLTCLKSSTISRLMYLICRDSPAQLFQVWCGCSCGSRPSSASGHKGDLTPRVWRVTGESPRRGNQAHMLKFTLVQNRKQH